MTDALVELGSGESGGNYLFLRAALFFAPFLDRAVFFAAGFDFPARRAAGRRDDVLAARRALFTTRFTVRLTARRAGAVRAAVFAAM